jgi:hypothetical protein
MVHIMDEVVGNITDAFKAKSGMWENVRTPPPKKTHTAPHSLNRNNYSAFCTLHSALSLYVHTVHDADADAAYWSLTVVMSTSVSHTTLT